MRDRIVDGVLDLFADHGELAPLFAIPAHPSNVRALQELSHRAIGLAKQGAMPKLEGLCARLHACLAEHRFEEAGAIGPALREERDKVRRAVAVRRERH
ncbi:MAG: hypothetical protein K9M02_10820 [Thiohalocapsa sp.]|nr:hypothetical protein [Thiohalocapsa sp.]